MNYLILILNLPSPTRRYLYTKKVQLDPSEICETYLAAKKYKELTLIDDLTAHIAKRWLVLSNAAILYDQLSKVPVDDPLLKEVKPSIEKFLASLRRMIEISSKDVFQSECFKRISLTGLANLLKFEQLNISEFELLQACLQWVDEELRREQRELNSTNRVALFKDLKHLIRFGDLNFEELGMLEIETYMTIDELGSVLLHLSNRSKPLGIEYRSPRDVFRKFSYSLLASTDGTMSGNFSTREVTFQLRVNKRILVESIEMQPLSVSDACFCRIYSDKNELELKFVPRKSETSWSIYFEEELLQLQPNVDYRLDLKFTIPYQGKSENFYFGQLSFSKQLNLKNDEVEVTCEIESGFGYHCIKSINFCKTN